MIVALDVHYETANAAAVVFRDWPDAQASAEYVAPIHEVEEYVPGEFYKRELPCLLTVLEQVNEPISTVIVDGYVATPTKPGLGCELDEAALQKYTIEHREMR